MAFINSLADAVFGTPNADSITTRSNNQLYSTIYGGLGNDIYFINAFYFAGGPGLDTDEDIVIEALGAGIDTVNLNMFHNAGLGNTSYTLADNVENLEADLSGPAFYEFNLTGNSLANKITVLSITPDTRTNLNGGAGNDTLIGGAFRDVLTGGSGVDVMQGGASNDNYYVDNALDQVIETAGNGNYDRVYSSATFTLGANVEQLILQGSANINGTGTAQDNGLYGNDGNNTLNGLAGNDELYGYAGNDVLNGGAGDDVLLGDSGNDVLNGGDGDDFLIGDNGNDTLNGGAGNDTLDGNAANSVFIDKLDGGAGDDLYRIFNANEIVADTGVGGNDSLITSAQLSGDLAAGIENLELRSFAGNAVIGRGNALNNIITGNNFNNSLFGLAGNDSLDGGTGNDILEGGAGNDTLNGGVGIGNDLMRGGDGNDTYFVDSTSDAAIETNASSVTGGIDTVNTSLATYTLGANLENLTLLTGAITATGNTLANHIIGNSADNSIDGGDGDDKLDGGLGADTLVGGAGNDVYIVDNLGDIVTELVGGTDRVESSVNIVLNNPGESQIENITLTGTNNINADGNGLDNMMIGNSGVNYLYGGSGSDTLKGGLGDDDLEGGIGIDSMVGGLGNDLYYVDVVGDFVVELAGQGTDIVRYLGTGAYTLGASVENLTLSTVAATNGTGNALNNVIQGNSINNVLSGAAGNDELLGLDGADALNGGDGNDTLNGGAGIDNMTGGLGNDTYYTDDAGDVITENAASGTDTLIYERTGAVLLSSFANIENVTLAIIGGTNITGSIANNILIGNANANSIDGGAGSDTLNGNDGADTLIGGIGDDTLNGGAGIDSMTGGAGNDVFFVDDIGDVVTELAVGGGTDRVESSIDFTLSADIENLTLTGADNINGTGNDLANVIKGNTGNNSLFGGIGLDTLNGDAGNDSLDGGVGIDNMSGGAGDDIYYVDNLLDKAIESLGAGEDFVYSSVSFTLGANIEKLKLNNIGGNINGTGNALGNRIYGNSGNNIISGLGGDDYSSGGLGNDVLNGGYGNDTLVGGADNDTLLGGAGNDQLNGGTGTNKLDGGAGNDLYLIYSASGIIADTGGGNDTVVTNVQLIGDLGAGIEQLQLNGSVITGRGNILNNFVSGNNVANSLFGLAGNDNLSGDGGNDTLDGGTGSDTLYGGTGDDAMTGGDGSDIYYVDSTLDVVNETNASSLTGGIDKVYSSATFTLGANVENLTLDGLSNIDGTGNALANKITGNTANNSLTGGDGADTLDGGIGNDTLFGGNGDDTYLVDSALDTVDETGTTGIDTVRSTVTFDLSVQVGDVENLVLLGTANIAGFGNGLANTITGNTGNDTLAGRGGDDTLIGGLGNDYLYGGIGADSMVGGAGDEEYYVDDAGDVVVELSGQGIDIVYYAGAGTYTLGANVENLSLDSPSNAFGIGNALNNTITGYGGNNSLVGGLGNDFLNGNGGNDTLDGGDGADVLDGGIGDDSMRGGLGNDTYVVDSSTDIVIETNVLGSGIDTVFSSASAFELGLNIENLTLLGGAIIGDGNNARNLIIGNANNNVLYGFGGIDTLNGGLGADTLDGGDGADIYYVDDSLDFVGEAGSDVAIDTIYSSAASFNLTTRTDGNVENIVLLSGAIDALGNSLANKITGNSGDNYLYGLDGNDTLNGGLGNDRLYGGANVDSLVGGAGDDRYYVDNALDKVIELAGQGFDQVYSSSNFSLALFANVEDLVLDNVATALNGTGNAGNNIIVGNSFSNLLIGGYGNDTLDGGGGGTDTVNGGAGNDLLIGSVLIGGTGNDTYLFTGSETITELALQGTDTIRSTAASSLSLSGAFAHIENAEIQNIAALNILGNGLNNLLTGNSSANNLDGGIGADTLNGGFGADTLIGGAGNDVYIVLDADVLTELVGGGIDRVESYSSFSLVDTDGAGLNGGNIENLTLTGSDNITGTGNALANTIKGNSGNNYLFGLDGTDTLIGDLGNDYLDGGAGLDIMTGGLGNDLYIVSSSGDKIIELAGQGTDTVYSSILFSLALIANVENLTLTGSDTIAGTGNALNNTIRGNYGANVLNGGAGNDTIDGWFGNDTLIGGDGNDTLNGTKDNDTLTGGAGNDIFVSDSSSIDTITDFVSGFDILSLVNIVNLTFTGAGFSLTANQFHLASAGAATIDTRIIYDQLSGALYYDADGNEGGGIDDIAQDQILQFTGITTPVLSSTDIFG